MTTATSRAWRPGVTTTDGYVPISCDVHSQLELAIMHRQRLHARWHDGNVWRDGIVLPLDLQTRQGEEFLICRLATGEDMDIRLDRLTRYAPA